MDLIRFNQLNTASIQMIMKELNRDIKVLKDSCKKIKFFMF